MSHEAKLAAAIAWLGKRWVFHKARRVPKGNYETVITKANVAETFAKVRRRKNGTVSSDLHS